VEILDRGMCFSEEGSLGGQVVTREGSSGGELVIMECLRKRGSFEGKDYQMEKIVDGMMAHKVSALFRGWVLVEARAP